jgi:hypothetical protein
MAERQEKELRFDFDDLFDDSARRRVWRKRLWRDLRRKEHEGSFDELRERLKKEGDAADDG